MTGGGYSLRDHITGDLTRSWRLTAAPPLTLGQVRVDGTARLMTRLAEADAPGVEVRRDRLELVADGRIDTATGTNPQVIPAAGWGLDFNAIRTRLWLPPGWDLLAVSGTDNTPDSWIARWTLLDLFLVLILSLGVGRLWGRGWGLLALVALALTWQVADAPRLVWVPLLAAAALLQWLPDRPVGRTPARLRALVQWVFRLSLLALLLIGLPFLVGQVRTGLYPHLDGPAVGFGVIAPDQAGGLARTAKTLAPDALAPATAPMDDAADGADMARQEATTAQPAPPAPPPDRPDPDAVVQSGMGVPDWRWNPFDLAWSGSVDPKETAVLWLLRPGWHLLWSLLGALLTVVLGLRVADLIGRPVTKGPPDDAPPAAPAPDADSAMPLSLPLSETPTPPDR